LVLFLDLTEGMEVDTKKKVARWMVQTAPAVQMMVDGLADRGIIAMIAGH
jgi:hypothetical protein